MDSNEFQNKIFQLIINSVYNNMILRGASPYNPFDSKLEIYGKKRNPHFFKVKI